ncbi:DUF4230 domain-containing protein [Neisseriaceae bacterium B1]
MKKIISLIIICALVAVAWHYKDQWLPEKNSPHQIISSAGVLAKIRELNRLESTSFYIDTIIRTEKQGNWYALWQDSQKGIFVAKGNAIAGLDLAKISEKDVTVLNDTVIINLPAVEVLSVQLNHIEVFDLKTGTLNLHQPDMSVLNTVQTQAKQQVLRQACQNGLLQHAHERSQAQIKQLFALANVQVSLYMPAAEAKCTMPKA